MTSEQSKPLFLTLNETVVLQKKEPNITYVDAFERQMKELFFIEHHTYIGIDKEVVYQTNDFKNFCSTKKNAFTHVYFSWNHTFVKTVQKDDYLKLKTNRNQDLITTDEQIILREYKVAVLGLSVGSNIAFVLTQAGISNSITLADFDELDTTNLNRILAGVHQIGLNKCDVAARRIYEDNPFADVMLWHEGVNEENLEIALKEGNIQCIIEEIDDMPFKIHARVLAMKYKIPVIMVTDNGDGIVLHVERYDLGYNKIFGKEVAYFEDKLKGPMTKEKAGQMIIFDIVGGHDKVDSRMMASVPRVIQKELVSWPQLGSAAIFGGVIATYMVKQIALGLNKELDIRAHINPLSSSVSKHGL